MNGDVHVAAGKSGAVVNVSKKNPLFGYIRVTQSRMVHNDEGWAEKKTLSALINGTVEHLKEFNYTDGQKLPGKIRIVERMKPFNTKNPEKDEKTAGENGIVCSVGGEPIYRNCFYTEKEDMEDMLVEHDNKAEIIAENARLEGADEANLS